MFLRKSASKPIQTKKSFFGSAEPEPVQPQYMVEDGNVVTIEYIILDEEGTILDTTDGKGVLSYIQGSKQLPLAFQEKLQGRQTGDKVKHSFNAWEVYGERDANNVMELERALLESDGKICAGMKFQIMTDDGLRCVTVIDDNEMDDNNVITVDLNHPLAGIPILFHATVVSVRPAAKEEMESGKVL